MNDIRYLTFVGTNLAVESVYIFVMLFCYSSCGICLFVELDIAYPFQKSKTLDGNYQTRFHFSFLLKFSDVDDKELITSLQLCTEKQL